MPEDALCVTAAEEEKQDGEEELASRSLTVRWTHNSGPPFKVPVGPSAPYLRAILRHDAAFVFIGSTTFSEQFSCVFSDRRKQVWVSVWQQQRLQRCSVSAAAIRIVRLRKRRGGCVCVWVVVGMRSRALKQSAGTFPLPSASPPQPQSALCATCPPSQRPIIILMSFLICFSVLENILITKHVKKEQPDDRGFLDKTFSRFLRTNFYLYTFDVFASSVLFYSSFPSSKCRCGVSFKIKIYLWNM